MASAQRTAAIPLVAVCVCTRARPQMLRRCLLSLRGQRFDPGRLQFGLVVVDNNPEPSAWPIYQELCGQRWPAGFVHCPRPGIPVARNKALDAALQAGAQYIAFLDDDEVAPPHWLQSLFEALASSGADAVQGGVRAGVGPGGSDTSGTTPGCAPVQAATKAPAAHGPRRPLTTKSGASRVIPELLDRATSGTRGSGPVPWSLGPGSRGRAPGRHDHALSVLAPDGPTPTPCESLATSNLLFKARLVVPPLSLRFDETMQFTGGSDREFFMRAHKRGARLRLVHGIDVFEDAHEERQSLAYKAMRAFAAGNNYFVRMRKNEWAPVAAARIALRALERCVSGLVKLAAAATLFLVLRPHAGRAHWRKGCLSLCFAAGCVTPVAGLRAHPYRSIQGA